MWSLFRPRSKPQRLPVPFIVGCGRSGTTLLRLMLDAHPEVAIPPETNFLSSVGTLRGRDEALRNALFQHIVQHETWPDFGLCSEDFCRQLADVRPFTISDGLRCFYEAYAAKFGKRRWGDKTPPYCDHLRKIHRLLPEARFLHLIRDRRDVAMSMRGMLWSPGDDVESLARYWCQAVTAARQPAKRCPHYLEVRYEQLVLNLSETLRAVCDFLQLEFSTEMERYHANARERLDEVESRLNAQGTVVVTKTQRLQHHRLTSQPPQASRIGRWKSEMTSDEQVRFVNVAGPLLAELGYETSENRKAA